MKNQYPRIRDLSTGLLLAAALCGNPYVSAQSTTTPVAPPTEAKGETAVVLTPFEVNSSKDTGYTAESSLAGSRLNASLRDTPATVQVYTKALLEDLGVIDLKDALLYSANVQDGAGDEQAFFGGNFAERGNVTYQPLSRGLPSSMARDYFRYQLPIDNYLTERIEESRGPNSLLFGIAAAGGIQNQSLKKASVNRNLHKATFITDSNELKRAELDLNQVLIKDRLALRVNSLYADGDGWRSNTFTKRKALHGAVTYQPDKKTIIRAATESFRQDDAVSNTFLETDFTSQWLAAGAPVYDLFSANRIPQASATGAIGATDRDTLFRKVGTTPNGTGAQVAIFQGGDPAFAGKPVSLFNVLSTAQFYSPAGNGVYNTAQNLARTESLYPYNVTQMGPATTRKLISTDYTVTVQRELVKNLFVQLDYNRNKYVWDPLAGNRQVRGDANAYFAGATRTPASAIPNPNAGKIFTEDTDITRYVTDRMHETFRATATYQFDFSRSERGWLSILGKHRVAVGLERMNYDSNQPVYREIWVDAITGRSAYATTTGGVDLVIRRKYLDAKNPGSWVGYNLDDVGVPMPDPLNPSRMIKSVFVQNLQQAWDVEEILDAKMISTQSFFFKDRLVVTGGYRNDTGNSKKFIQKLNDTGNSWLRKGPNDYVKADWDLNNYTAGAVLHLNRAHTLSVFYNQATNSNIPSAEDVIIGSLDKPGQITYPGAGKGHDFGVMTELWDGRINVRLGRYESSQGNALNGAGAAALSDTYHNQIIAWWDDLGFGLPNEPAKPRRFTDRVNRYALSKAAEGYEMQLTANLTPNWRTTVNFSYTDQKQTNVGLVERAWIDDFVAWMTRTVQTWNPATITPAWTAAGIKPTNDITVFTGSTGTPISTMITNLHNFRDNNLIPGAPFGQRRTKANFFTSYKFSAEALKGFSMGGGYRYQSPNVMHFVKDAAGKATTTPYLGQSTSYADAMLRYNTKFKLGSRNVRTSFQINVRNLLNDHDPIVARYRNNDITAPADRAYYVEPRSWQFTTIFDF
jgi:outer membrane receptor for ferric coprogen and ferric-rhodotorulic acid